jgi:hypothetical protein
VVVAAPPRDELACVRLGADEHATERDCIVADVDAVDFRMGVGVHGAAAVVGSGRRL